MKRPSQDRLLTTVSSKWRWAAFGFLFAMILLAQPYQKYWTLDNEAYHVTADADIQIKALEEGDLGRRICLPLMGVFAAIAFSRTAKNKLSIQGALGPSVIFFFAWACLSVTWADDLLLTVKRVVILLLLFLASLAIARQFSAEEILEFAFFSSGSILILGFVSTVSIGRFHPLEASYRFGGIMHPNDQAQCCSILLLSSLALAGTKKGRLLGYYLVTAVALSFLVLTKSRTAFASALLAWLVYGSIRLSRMQITACLLLLICAAGLVYLFQGDDLLSGMRTALFLGRMDESSGTLNSRLPLWQECAGYFWEAPVLGYGYNSFWTAHHYSSIGASQEWGMGSAHNGYLDLALGVGSVGLISFVSILIVATRRAVIWAFSSRSAFYAFAAAFLVDFSLNNFLESIILFPNIIILLLYILLAKVGFAHAETQQ